MYLQDSPVGFGAGIVFGSIEVAEEIFAVEVQIGRNRNFGRLDLFREFEDTQVPGFELPDKDWQTILSVDSAERMNLIVEVGDSCGGARLRIRDVFDEI